MIWLKRISILVGVLILISIGSLFLYGVAYSDGETAGYNNGYSTGTATGYNLGEADGYISGKADGYDEGLEAGLGHGYTLKDPTYSQAVAFLRQDKTDNNKYIEDSYVCSHFARDVDNNAEEEGFRCAYVGINYPDGGHAIIAFDTIDKGLVYFDAITDESVKPVVDKRYYQCIEPKPGYYYEEPSYDDTIVDILVVW